MPRSIVSVSGAAYSKGEHAVPRCMQASAQFISWLVAMRGSEAGTAFEYAAPLTETMLLGIAALRSGQGRKLYYDAASMTFTNAAKANALLTREYRPGWAI